MPSVFQNKNPGILGLRPATQGQGRPSFSSLAKENNGPGFFGGNFANNRARQFPAEQAFANAAPQAQENATAFQRNGTDSVEPMRGPPVSPGQQQAKQLTDLLGRRFVGEDAQQVLRHKIQRDEKLGEFRTKITDLAAQFKAEIGLDPDAPMSEKLRKEFRSVYKDQLAELREQYLSGFAGGNRRRRTAFSGGRDG